MSATMQHLHNLWGRAMLDGDFEAARRWREARERLEIYEARRTQAHPCVGCPWENTDTCRACPMEARV